MSSSKPGKTTAIISYITIIGCLIAITMNMEPKNEFARFHIRQAFGIHLLYHAIAIFLNSSDIDSGWLFLYGLYLICWVYGLVSAIQSKKNTLPLLGSYFQKWFTFIP
ncbi:hypothetical protein [Flagellimonas allohymeniacidonis]|uniref:DUF4870 domain-containing protein n=1 Tax=Flagellimonas allohymeniacidonis TaxID=2517819 RepID=A0A4Q8QKC0_9FLAO|nr:hypothetical protein [Allomuricauda hymeniacidonis]TAI48686.1 hypothetical protein EW142_02480 [Allomuricauda hymeniacidonis]